MAVSNLETRTKLLNVNKILLILPHTTLVKRLNMRDLEELVETFREKLEVMVVDWFGSLQQGPQL